MLQRLRGGQGSGVGGLTTGEQAGSASQSAREDTEMNTISGSGWPTTCRSCDAPIEWHITKAGKIAPYNPPGEDGETISHFATCPEAGQWRRKPAPRTRR